MAVVRSIGVARLEDLRAILARKCGVTLDQFAALSLTQLLGLLQSWNRELEDQRQAQARARLMGRPSFP